MSPMALSSPLDLSGRVALVTGGSRGVGAATARLLARFGARVALTYHTRVDDAQAVVASIRQSGGEAVAFGADLAQETEAAPLFDQVERALGPLDIFVGNHGIWPPMGVPLQEMTTEQWRNTLAVNLDSIFFLTREAAGRLQEGGRIVLVSSTAAQRGEAFHGDYAASKGAMISLVKGLCVELGERGITVNSVAPGWVDTEMSAPALTPDVRGPVEGAIPLGRVASAEDVAGPIVFLCSPLARHITGEILNVNGGAVLAG